MYDLKTSLILTLSANILDKQKTRVSKVSSLVCTNLRFTYEQNTKVKRNLTTTKLRNESRKMASSSRGCSQDFLSLKRYE